MKKEVTTLDNMQGFGLIIYLTVIILVIVSYWKIFEKAGEPGWKCLIPILNILVLLKISKRPGWWVIFFFIPVVNILVGIVLTIDFVLVFGQPSWHFVPAILFSFIYLPWMAFNDEVVYVG